MMFAERKTDFEYPPQPSHRDLSFDANADLSRTHCALDALAL